jgi:DinB superfamily
MSQYLVVIEVTKMDTTLDEIRSLLMTTPTRWLRLTEYLPAALLERRPAADEWSAVECLRHLLDTEREVFPVRMRLLLTGNDLPSYDPDRERSASDNSVSPHQTAQEFERLRTSSLALFGEIGLADLDRGGLHEEFGRVTLAELLNEWAAHDLNHTVQAEEALMQSFIRGSGPWRLFFAAHDSDR